MSPGLRIMDLKCNEIALCCKDILQANFSDSQTPLNDEHLQENVAAAISPLPLSSSGDFSSSSLIGFTRLSSLPPQSAIENLQTG
ncbi:hypothetical protein Tco_0846217 [Tanacetum coccineum]